MDQDTTNIIDDAFYNSATLEEAVKRGQTAGNSYYLVRNTIKATEVTYSFDRSISADVDVGVTPATLGTVEAKAGFSNEAGTTYSKTFTQPQIVCVQTERLTVQGATPRLTPFSAPAPRWDSGPGDRPLFRP